MLSPLRLAALSPLVALALFGCAEIEPAPPPRHPHASSPSAADTPAEAKAEGEKKPAEATGRKEALAPRVGAEDVADGHQALADAIVQASKGPMAECVAGSGAGVVRVRVKSTDRSASFDIEPGSIIDEKMRHCVLEALSTIDVPDTLSQASPSSRPSSGFSSVIKVQW